MSCPDLKECEVSLADEEIWERCGSDMFRFVEDHDVGAAPIQIEKQEPAQVKDHEMRHYLAKNVALAIAYARKSWPMLEIFADVKIAS